MKPDGTRPRILVIGDIILDHDVFLKSTKCSPEGVHVGVREGADLRLGGAGAVAVMAEALGADVWLSGVVGQAHFDVPQALVLQRTAEKCIECDGIILDENRPQTVKTRYYLNGKQVFREDCESTEMISRRIFNDLVDGWPTEENQIPDVILIADYGKGVVCGAMTEIIRGFSEYSRVPILVDPALGRGRDWYPRADWITPNRCEFELSNWDNYDGAIVHKMDQDGVRFSPWMGRDKSRTWTQIGSEIQDQSEVVDVSGAGDMLLAALGVFLAEGVNYYQAVILANRAAGLKCKQHGATPVDRKSIVSGVGGLHWSVYARSQSCQ